MWYTNTRAAWMKGFDSQRRSAHHTAYKGRTMSISSAAAAVRHTPRASRKGFIRVALTATGEPLVGAGKSATRNDVVIMAALRFRSS